MHLIELFSCEYQKKSCMSGELRGVIRHTKRRECILYSLYGRIDFTKPHNTTTFKYDGFEFDEENKLIVFNNFDINKFSSRGVQSHGPSRRATRAVRN